MIISKSLPISYLFGKIKYDLIGVTIISIIATILIQYASNVIPEMPLNIPAFLGTAISVLLSFKMGQSYDRWWEARRIWGAIVNDSRSLVLQLKGFCPTEVSMIKNIAHSQIAWCYSLVSHLRGTENNGKIAAHLQTDKWQEVKSKLHVPLSISDIQVREIQKLREKNAIDGFAHTQIDTTLNRLIESMGMAERIKNTVFPTTYRYILHVSIYVFIVLLDISLKNLDFIFQFPLLIVISSIFFLLEKSSSNLQDPFKNEPTDTPMLTICNAIEGNLKELIGEHYEKPTIDKKLYYQM